MTWLNDANHFMRMIWYKLVSPRLYNHQLWHPASPQLPWPHIPHLWERWRSFQSSIQPGPQPSSESPHLLSYYTISPPSLYVPLCRRDIVEITFQSHFFVHCTTEAAWFSLSLGYLNKKDHFLMVINVTKASIPKNRSLKQSGHHHIRAFITRSLHNGPIFCQRMWNE